MPNHNNAKNVTVGKTRHSELQLFGFVKIIDMNM